MVFADQFTIKGTLRLPNADAANVVAICRHDRFDPLAVLEVHIIGGNWSLFWQMNPFPQVIEIALDDDRGRVILSRPMNARMELVEAKITFAEWTRLPPDEDVIAGETVRVEVELAAAGLVADRRNTAYRRDGSVERVEKTGDPDVIWRSQGASWTLGIGYNSSPLADQAPRSVALISCAMMRTEWNALADTTVPDVISRVEAQLKDSTRLLSFISRASTPWMQITVCVLKKDGRHVQQSATKRLAARQLRSGLVGPMFTQEDAASSFEGLLGQLTQARAEITRAIDFVVASWCAENMPAALVLLHAALEAIVSTVVDATPTDARPSSSQLKKLEGVVKAAIRDFGASNGWSSAVVDDFLEKAPEVKRPPIVKLICRLLPRLDVYTNDLWGDPGELEHEIRKAFSYRNKLVHSAVAEETSEDSDRLMRLALLTERIILRALGFTWFPHSHQAGGN